MSEYNLSTLTQAVIDRFGDTPDPRLKQLITGLVQHLHTYIREVDLKPDEWFAALQFLTKTGQISNDKRAEFMLLSDTLGVSMLVVALAQARAGATGSGATAATEATVQGPYYWEGAPELANGADIAKGTVGEPTLYRGTVTDTSGKPIAGAVLDIWSGDGEGNYDMDIAGLNEMRARAKIHTDAEGRYWFWSIRPNYYPIPMDGPVGVMFNATRRQPNRPGHIHLMVSAPGHVPVTTHLFVKGTPYLDIDPVFGVRQSLIIDYQRHPAGKASDGREMKTPYWSADYDFRLASAR